MPHRLDLTYRVLATVTDAHGAALSAFLDFTTQDRPPTAGIDVRGTTWDDGNYRLLSPVTLSPLPSKDPDAEDLCDLAYQFAFVDLPVASNPTLAECGTDYRTGCTAPVPTTCFTPDVAGSYQVQLTVTDSAGATATATAFVIVDPDQPPCLRQLTPQPEGTIVVSRSDLSVTLAANVVEDDLDPYPLGATNLPGFPRFAWAIQLPGDVAPVAVADYDRNAYTLDLAAFSIGDTIGARVEVADRTPRSSCASADDGCPVGVDPLTGCVQRVTWTLEVR